MRSVSAFIFCSAWASEVSRAFSVSAKLFDRSVSDARPCSSSRVLPSSASRAAVSRSTTFSVALRAMVASTVGARGQSLAHLGEQFLSGGGTRTQSLEPQIQGIGFGLMSLVGLVARGGQRDALVLGSRQADVHLFQPRTRGSQGVLALGEATRQARRLCQRLIERRLQRALVILQQQEFFPHERTLGLQFDNPLIGAIGVIDENLVGLAERSAIRGLLRQLALEFGDLRTRSHDFAGELGLVTFEPARGLLHQRQFPPQLLARAFQFRRPLFEHTEFAAHGLVTGAKLCQR